MTFFQTHSSEICTAAAGVKFALTHGATPVRAVGARGLAGTSRIKEGARDSATTRGVMAAEESASGAGEGGNGQGVKGPQGGGGGATVGSHDSSFGRERLVAPEIQEGSAGFISCMSA